MIIGIIVFLFVKLLFYTLFFDIKKFKFLKIFTITSAAAFAAAIPTWFLFDRLHKIYQSNFCLPYLWAFSILILVEILCYYKFVKARKLYETITITLVINFLALFICSFFTIAFRHSAGESAKRISCTSNLKQLGLSLKQYALDNNCWLPGKPGALGLEQLRINNYLVDHRIYVCPSRNNSTGKGNEKLNEKNVCYVYRNGLKDIGQLNAANIPVAWDKPDNHKNYGNVLYLDGHVKGFHGIDWMERAGIKQAELEDRIRILPVDSSKDTYTSMHNETINKIKDPDFKKIAQQKSFDKWQKYEDKYFSFIYPDHSQIKLIVSSPKDDEDEVLISYSLQVGKNTYCSWSLIEEDIFDDEGCFCARIVFIKYLFVDGTLLRCDLMRNGYVKGVQALSEKYRVSFAPWTHSKMKQAVYLRLASSIRFIKPGDEQKLRKNIYKTYGKTGFIEKGMSRNKISSLFGKPSKIAGKNLIYDNYERSYLHRTTISLDENDEFSGFQKGWNKTFWVKPKRGSVRWIEEKVGIYVYKQENCDEDLEDNQLSQVSYKGYYDGYYYGSIVPYDLGPLTKNDVDFIYKRSVELLPHLKAAKLQILCNQLYHLADYGFMNKCILPILIKRYKKEIMPNNVSNIFYKYKVKNIDNLLINQIKLIYAQARKTKDIEYGNFPLFSVLQTLARHAPKKAKKFIIEGVKHPKAEIRNEAYYFADRLPRKEAIPLLQKGLSDENPDTRQRCAELLLKVFGNKDNLELVEKVLKREKDEYVQKSLSVLVEAFKKKKNRNQGK